jgi:hypothetical protein
MQPRPLPLGVPSGPFSVRAALGQGVSAKRLRAGDLTIPHRGVRGRSPSLSLAERCRDYAPLLGESRAFSHTTALALWGLPLPSFVEQGPLHVAAFGVREPRRRGVVGHRLEPRATLRLAGCTVVAPIEAWAQAATLLPLDDLVIVADGLQGLWSTDRRARLLERDALADIVRRCDGDRGAVRLRKAFELSRQGVRSPGETRLRLLLQRGGIPDAELNGDVDDAAGNWLGTSDLVYRDARVVLEYEGDYHRVDRQTFENDILRRERYADHDWRLVRVTRGDLRDHPAELLARVRRLVVGGR